jgi:cytochrome c peroxidase
VLLLDLGLTIPQRRTPDLPLYTFTRTADGTTIRTTDPGLALTSGKWTDMAKFKVPVLRALAMRAPYFHDGSAPDLQAVVGFYDQRFRLALSPQDRNDLVAFLQSL